MTPPFPSSADASLLREAEAALQRRQPAVALDLPPSGGGFGAPRVWTST
jgi:hypothetical protein